MQQIVIVFLSTKNFLSFSKKLICGGRIHSDIPIIAGVSKIVEINICHFKIVSTDSDLLPGKIINVELDNYNLLYKKFSY